MFSLAVTGLLLFGALVVARLALSLVRQVESVAERVARTNGHLRGRLSEVAGEIREASTSLERLRRGRIGRRR